MRKTRAYKIPHTKRKGLFLFNFNFKKFSVNLFVVGVFLIFLSLSKTVIVKRYAFFSSLYPI